jgi:nitrous oxidase accessory protein NosD
VNASSDVRVLGNRLAGHGAAGLPRLSDIQVNGLGRGISSVIEIAENECTSRDTEFGICCFDANHLRVTDNRVSGARTGSGDNGGYGIVVYATMAEPASCHDNVVSHNLVEGTEGTGIYLVRARRTRVEANEVRDVARSQGDATLPTGGIALNDCVTTTLAGNRVSSVGGGGIVVSTSASLRVDVVIERNLVRDARHAGVVLRGKPSEVDVRRNTLSGRSQAVIDWPNSRPAAVRVQDNEIQGASGIGGAIELQGLSSGRVTGNRFNDVALPAIDVAVGAGRTVVVSRNRVRVGGADVREGAVRLRTP